MLKQIFIVVISLGIVFFLFSCEEPLSMELVAYGSILADGTIRDGSGNYTINHVTGRYIFTWTDGTQTASENSHATANPDSLAARFCTVAYYTTEMTISIYSLAGTLADTPFTFAVYTF